jgi:uncharacterized delta-60 repeat protein
VSGDFTSVNGVERRRLARLLPDGSLDVTFTAHLETLSEQVFSVALQPDGKILVGGLGSFWGVKLYRLNPDGTLDSLFRPSEKLTRCSGIPRALLVQADGRIVVGGDFYGIGFDGPSGICRLNPNGSYDESFHASAGGVRSLSGRADGKVVVAGYITHLCGQPRLNIGRINADGELDTNFNASATGVVTATALQPDGRLLLVGTLDALDGESRSCIGRLSDGERATQAISNDGTSVTWCRSGNGPEVSRVEFAYSLNGLDWSNMGPGFRTECGWRVLATDLPVDCRLRVRAFATGSTASWFFECVYPKSQPEILFPEFAQNAGSGVFQLSLIGSAGSYAVLEVSTDLNRWTALKTNLLGSGFLTIIDPTGQGNPLRFYRLRLE